MMRPDTPSYTSDMTAWRHAAETSLHHEWLGLVACVTLRHGLNRLGTDPNAEIVLPVGSAPEHVGVLNLVSGAVILHAARGVPITVNGTPVTRPTQLCAVGENTPDRVALDSLIFVLFANGTDMILYVYNTHNPALLDNRKNQMTLSDNAAQIAADRTHLLPPQHHPNSHLDPQIWVAGEGALITNSAGKIYLDGMSGMWNVHVGHGRREMVAAASKQLESLAFTSSYIGDTSLSAIALTEQLSTICSPAINTFFFTSGGTETNDSVLKTARFYWKSQGRPEKVKIIAQTLSYHAASSTSHQIAFWQAFEPQGSGLLYIESPYPYRFNGDVTTTSPGIAAANLLEEIILREGPETVAAFLAAPIQCDGVIVPPDDYFPRIRAICDQYDVLLISDEVITGFGRTGRWFGIEHWGIEPDIVSFAQGITSAYLPLGGIGISDQIKATIETAPAGECWIHRFISSAHPVCCAVALANLEIIREERLVERAARLGAQFLTWLKDLEQLEHVGEVRGLGLLVGIEIVANQTTKTRFPAEAAVGKRLQAELTRRGLYTRVLDEVICLAPPLVISEAQLDHIVDILYAAIPAVLAT